MNHEKHTLEEFRGAIDTIDEDILALLARRTELVQQVGQLKARTAANGSFMRPGREASMLRSLTSKIPGDFPKWAVAAMWRIIISASLNIEHPIHIAVYTPKGNKEPLYKAREYFGSFTSMSAHSTIGQVLEKAINGAHSVAVLPLPTLEHDYGWWRLMPRYTSLRIFAFLPFFSANPMMDMPLVALANVTPEATGSDKTILILEGKKPISMDTLTQSFTRHGLQLEYLRINTDEPSMPVRFTHLVAVNDFIAENDARMAAILESLEKYGISARSLGSYATPLTFEQK